MSLHLRLDQFDGPLDVLLHLIKVQEVNIFNIPISLICQQFLAFVKQTRNTFDFQQAGDYLLMSTQLVEIKVRMLLPSFDNTPEDPKTLDDVDPQDPRRDLVTRLLELEAIKNACDQWQNLKILGQDVFVSGEHKRRQQEFVNLEQPLKGDPFSLAIAFEKALLAFADHSPAPRVKVQSQKITLQEKMDHILAQLSQYDPWDLFQAFQQCENRYEMIVLFLAVLELAKNFQIRMEQKNLFSNILIQKNFYGKI